MLKTTLKIELSNALWEQLHKQQYNSNTENHIPFVEQIKKKKNKNCIRKKTSLYMLWTMVMRRSRSQIQISMLKKIKYTRI